MVSSSGSWRHRAANLVHAITVAEKWPGVQTFLASDLGERCAALVRQAVFLEAARGLVGNRPLNQPSAPNYLTKTRQIT